MPITERIDGKCDITYVDEIKFKNFEGLDLKLIGYTQVNGSRLYLREEGGEVYPVGFKVVLREGEIVTSTGLNNTPVVEYPEGEWFFSEGHGIYSGRVPSLITYLVNLLRSRKNNPKNNTEGHLALLREPIAIKKDGIQSGGMKLLEKIVEQGDVPSWKGFE